MNENLYHTFIFLHQGTGRKRNVYHIYISPHRDRGRNVTMYEYLTSIFLHKVEMEMCTILPSRYIRMQVL
jgi:hypothetical protein